MTGEQKTGQLKGPFIAGRNILYDIDENFIPQKDSIIQIGIQAEPGTKFKINNDSYEIGNTGLYEQMDTKIVSLSFDNNMNEKTFVEYIMIAF